MGSRVAKYRLCHLIEDDWRTYHKTRTGVNLNRQKRLTECRAQATRRQEAGMF